MNEDYKLPGQLSGTQSSGGEKPMNQTVLSSTYGGGSVLAPITAATLTPTPTFNPVQPEVVPTPSVAGLNSDLTLQPLEGEKQQSDIVKQTRELFKQLAGETTFLAEQEQAQGLTEKMQTERDLASRLKSLQNEALAIPLQLQQEAAGRGVTAGGLRPIQTSALRNNAIQALSTAALLEGARGNVTAAQQLADRATAQRFDPIKAEIAANLQNLELLSKDPTLTLAQTNRLNAQREAQNARARVVAKQEANAKEISNVLNTAIKYGLSDTSLMERIQNATSPLEAQQLAVDYLQDPKAKYELRAAQLDNIYKQAQIAKLQRETELLGRPTPSELKAEREALRTAKGAVPVLQRKIALIDAIVDSPALDSVVGTSLFTRAAGSPGGVLGRFVTGAVAGGVAGLPFGGVGAIPGAVIGGVTLASQGAVDKLSGARQDLIGSVEQLISKEFLDSLISVKAQGATFGALTAPEQKALTDAATKIGTWRLREGDKENGAVVGYNASEESFKKEVQTIQELARKAAQVAGGSLFSDDESSMLDDLFYSDVIDPSQFY